MKRRTFLKSLLAIPFALKLIPWAGVAQSAEQRFRKPTVEGSTPSTGSNPTKPYQGFYWYPDDPRIRNHWVPNDPERLKFDEKLWKQHDDWLFHFYRSIARSRILPYTRLEP